jgi:hypothetical protein
MRDDRFGVVAKARSLPFNNLEILTTDCTDCKPTSAKYTYLEPGI